MGNKDAQQGQASEHKQRERKLRRKYDSPVDCASLSTNLSVNNLPISIAQFSIIHLPPNLLVFWMPPSRFAPITLGSQHWRQSGFQYVECCQQKKAPDSADSHIFWHPLSLWVCELIFSTHCTISVQASPFHGTTVLPMSQFVCYQMIFVG